MKTSVARRRRRPDRSGTAAVEVAMILPVFFAFVFGLVEYGRLQMVSNMLATACRTGARHGSIENVTTSDTIIRAKDILSSVVNPNLVSVIVKDAGVYDTAGPYPSTAAEYNALANIELSQADPRQLFLVRASVSYNDVALIPFSVLSGITLTGQAMMRHE